MNEKLLKEILARLTALEDEFANLEPVRLAREARDHEARTRAMWAILDERDDEKRNALLAKNPSALHRLKDLGKRGADIVVRAPDAATRAAWSHFLDPSQRELVELAFATVPQYVRVETTRGLSMTCAPRVIEDHELEALLSVTDGDAGDFTYTRDGRSWYVRPEFQASGRRVFTQEVWDVLCELSPELVDYRARGELIVTEFSEDECKSIYLDERARKATVQTAGLGAHVHVPSLWGGAA